MIFEFIFWISVCLLMHTYLIYPLIVRFLAKDKENNTDIFTNPDNLPTVSIIMAVHNVENSIERKIQSVFDSDYPLNKLTFYIGSDASEDNTNAIIQKLAETHKQIKFERFESRVGKIQIINTLAKEAEGEILLFTDAHAIFTPKAIYHLVKHFRNKEIHIVGGRMQTNDSRSGNIGLQEKSYFENEYKVKFAEGKLWGCMMGAFGSFYAVRNENWNPVPDKFLGDDFYISIKAIEKGGKAIFEPEAFVNQKVPGDINEEYKRKKRIAIGNFQNLGIFYKLLFSSRKGLAFSFFSHKILRWFGPIFILLAIISLIFIFKVNLMYSILFIIMLLSLFLPIIDYFHVKFRIHIVLLRFITHFYYMNIALLDGMFSYLKGVKSNVWEPTKRD